MNNTGKVLVSLASGVALGAVLGILFAPDKGSETRRKIKKNSKKISDDVKHKFEDIKTGLKSKVQEFAKSEN